MDNETEKLIRTRLIADRLRKLEATILAYDACLNTGAVDRMRKRIDELERALATLLGSDLSDSAKQAIRILLSKKFP